MTPFFSICLPVYNGAEYIGKAIQSVLDQTDQDWELVIYNNGSTDNTSNVIHCFRDARIRVIEETARASRAIPAWHKAMSMGQGEYRLMLGHDDWFKSDFLEVSHKHIQTNDLDVFSGWTDSYDPDYRLVEIVTSASFIQSVPEAKQVGDLWLFNGKSYIEGFLADFEQGFSKMHLSTTWIRRTLYEQVGGFNVNLQYCAESELYLKLAHAGARFGFYWGRALVNYIGKGENRRASYLDVNRKYHDFYEIPRIMLREGIVDKQKYSVMIKFVNSKAVLQGFGYSASRMIANIRNNTSEKVLLWTVISLFGSLWSRTRLIVDEAFRRVFRALKS